LEIWTDGTVEPKETLMSSSKILMSYFNQIVNPKKPVKKDTEAVGSAMGVATKLSVEEIGLPTRVANALVRSGFETVDDLVKAKREALVKVRNLGEKSVKIVEAALGERGLSFEG